MNILENIFRANPAYRIVTVGETGDRRARSGHFAQSAFLLVPVEAKDYMDAIDLDLATANVFYSLKTPQRLTLAHLNIFTQNASDSIAGMVYDDILQVQRADGDFEGGPGCRFTRKANNISEIGAPQHRLSQLSQNAIQYALHFAHLDEYSIACSLYGYNTYPYTINNGLVKSLRCDEERGVSWNSTKLAGYHFHESQHWLHWQFKRNDPLVHLPYKLYVSPALRNTFEVFSTVAEVCRKFSVPAFKTGVGINGILRPDKMVLYFSEKGALAIVANELNRVLRGVDAQGVPFTNPFESTAIISWAVEPNSISINYERLPSWRMYVSRCIARSMKLFFLSNPGEISVPLIMKRIRLMGIEPDDWNPILKS